MKEKLHKITAKEFVNKEMAKVEKRLFAFRIFGVLIGYVAITLLLNAIRATAPIGLVWVLIIIQFILYFSIFFVSYERAKKCGLKSGFSFVIFVILAVLGRVNDWELFIIPLFIIVMLIVSAKHSIKI